MSIKKLLLKKIHDDTVKRYNERLEKYGYGSKSLGWDSKENQMVRFNAALSLVDTTDKIVLDIGCGFGDLLDAIYLVGQKPKLYIGVDINRGIVNIARKRHPEAKFLIKNILLESKLNQLKSDIVFINGVLNFNLKRYGINNYDYAENFIRKAWSLCKDALLVDMLSLDRDSDYPVEDFVFYYSPETMFSFAKSLTTNIVLKHDYPSIPQREFLLLLRV